jgi:hypothetical protein
VWGERFPQLYPPLQWIKSKMVNPRISAAIRATVALPVPTSRAVL